MNTTKQAYALGHKVGRSVTMAKVAQRKLKRSRK